MIYPKVGDKFYWKDINGNISESFCKKISIDPLGKVMTMYYTYLSPNGGGYFVNENSIIDSNSSEVLEYRKQILKSKIDDFINKLNDEDLYNEILKRLEKNYLKKTAKNILDNIIHES